jgi:hypothetical protein
MAAERTLLHMTARSPKQKSIQMAGFGGEKVRIVCGLLLPHRNVA